MKWEIRELSQRAPCLSSKQKKERSITLVEMLLLVLFLFCLYLIDKHTLLRYSCELLTASQCIFYGISNTSVQCFQIWIRRIVVYNKTARNVCIVQCLLWMDRIVVFVLYLYTAYTWLSAEMYLEFGYIWKCLVSPVCKNDVISKKSCNFWKFKKNILLPYRALVVCR